MPISIKPINIKLTHECEFLTERNTLATNKASVLNARNTPAIRQANELFAGAERSRYEAWFVLYGDFIASGVKSPKTYAEALSKNDNITTALPKRQTEDVLLAIKRCVAKYGTISKVKSEHAKWCKDKKNKHTYAYPDVSNLKKFAPEGQRSKNTDNVVAKDKVEITLNTCVSRLMSQGYSRQEARRIGFALGLK